MDKIMMVPPSPSQLPKPRAVRERNATLRQGDTGRRGRSGSGSGSRGGSPKPQHQSRPNENVKEKPGIDESMAADAILRALREGAFNERRMEPGLSKERFADELLSMIQHKDAFVDKVYAKYLEASQLRADRRQRSKTETIDLKD